MSINNKKRFLTFITVIVVLVLGVAAFFTVNRLVLIDTIARVDEFDSVLEFYNSSIPGYERAEELDLVRYIGRSYDIPEKEGLLNIEKIWYSKNNAYILYSIEKTKNYGILMGEMYVHYEDSQAPELMWMSSGIGNEDIRGVLYKGKFYSFVKLDVIDGAVAKDLENIINISFNPKLAIKSYNRKSYITQEDVIHNLGILEVKFKSEDVEENVQKLALGGQMIIDQKPFVIYQLDMGTSNNRLYFHYNNAEKDMVYKIEGKIITDLGEERDISGYTNVITEIPYHYTLNFKPFNKIPNSIELVIDNIKLVSSNSISFSIKADEFSGKKNEVREIGAILSGYMNTDILLKSFLWNENGLGFELKYETKVEMKSQAKRLISEMPITGDETDKYNNPTGVSIRLANVVQANNDSNIRASHEEFGLRGVVSEDSLLVYLKKEYVKKSNVINVVINNLPYKIYVDEGIKMKIETQEE